MYCAVLAHVYLPAATGQCYGARRIHVLLLRRTCRVQRLGQCCVAVLADDGLLPTSSVTAATELPGHVSILSLSSLAVTENRQAGVSYVVFN